MSKARATLEFCDNPGCFYSEVVQKNDEGATGFHFGKGYWVQGGGGPIPAFYAHERECIMPAFEAAMKRA